MFFLNSEKIPYQPTSQLENHSDSYNDVRGGKVFFDDFGADWNHTSKSENEIAEDKGNYEAMIEFSFTYFPVKKETFLLLFKFRLCSFIQMFKVWFSIFHFAGIVKEIPIANQINPEVENSKDNP